MKRLTEVKDSVADLSHRYYKIDDVRNRNSGGSGTCTMVDDEMRIRPAFEVQSEDPVQVEDKRSEQEHYHNQQNDSY